MRTKRRLSYLLSVAAITVLILPAGCAQQLRQAAAPYGAPGASSTLPAAVAATLLPGDPLTSPLATPNPLEPTPVPIDPVEYALDCTRELFPSITGGPHVVYSAPITVAQFPEYGLGDWQPFGEEPPMALVLVAGDFDVSNFSVSQPISFARAKYIGYVVDMRAAAMNTVTISEDGAHFANLLQSLGLWEATPVPIVAPTETAQP